VGTIGGGPTVKAASSHPRTVSSPRSTPRNTPESRISRATSDEFRLAHPLGSGRTLAQAPP
jgi:hypothetical protein